MTKFPVPFQIVILWLTINFAAGAAPPDTSSPEPPAAVGTSETTIPAAWYRFAELAPQLSVVQAIDLTLGGTNQQFRYPQDGVGFLLPQINFVFPIAKTSLADIAFAARFGYAQRIVTALIENESGSSPVAFRLHWLPVSGWGRFMFHVPGLSFLKPTLFVGTGTQLFHQTGTSDGLAAWVPFVYVTPAIVVLEAAPAPEDWWGGFTFGTTFSRDLSSTHTANSIAFDLIFTLHL